MCQYVCASIAYMTIREMPIVTLSVTVVAISITVPAKRRILCLGFGTTSLAPVDKYMQRPASLKDMTFTTFFRTYKDAPAAGRRPAHCLEERVLSRDESMAFYERDPAAGIIVRFTNFHPTYQKEAFFYSYLLDKVPFETESDLLSSTNPDGSYYTEAILRRLFTTPDQLARELIPYMEHNLYTPARLAPHIQQLLVDRNPSDPVEAPSAAGKGRPTRGPTLEMLQQEFAWTAGSDIVLNTEQQRVFNHITAHPYGLQVIGGGGGGGKTLLVKCIAHFLRSAHPGPGLVINLSATTGAAAQRLSEHATTTHSLMGIRGKSTFVAPLQTSSDIAIKLVKADVVVSAGKIEVDS